MLLPFALALIAFSPPPVNAASPAKPPGVLRREGPSGGGEASDKLQAYLRRPMPRSARFLDHGVISLSGAGGAPHFYRLDLRVGLFDHVSVGATAHWLPGQPFPQVWPVGAI